MAGAINTLYIGDRQNTPVMLGGGMQLSESDIFTDDKWLKDGGLQRHELLRFLSDIRYEPSWRKASDRDVDYYDGHQLDATVLKIFKKRGIPPLVINLIQPTVNAVLGLEAKTRSDAEVTYEDDASENVAIALNKKMHEAERESYTDRACSEAYASQIKAGLGWVEVTDNPHPLQYRYRVNAVHRRELWWDWHDTHPGLDGGRFVVRKKWFDNDVLERILPPVLQGMVGTEQSLDGLTAIAQHLNDTTGFASSNDLERPITMEQAEWRDRERRRTILYEVWYRVWIETFVARLPNDQVIELDPQNDAHMALIGKGMARPMRALWPKMRQSFWLGPHRFLDRWSPLPHQGFPYVPFWGFREDLSSTPYGLIRAMISPQDEINARRSKMMALMSARRVRADADAVSMEHNTHADVAAQASAHDHYIILNPQRKNLEGFQIDNNLDLSAPQLQVLQEAKAEIHQVSGIFNAQQGEGRSGQSGYALNTLVEQGNTTLAEINDNYRYARRLVYDRLLSHIKRDSCHEHAVKVGEGTSKKVVWLNQKQPEGGEILNDVAMSTAKVILQDVPSSQGYRQQQFMILTELCKALPPQVQQFVIDFIIEASEIPERKKVAARIRQGLHLPDPNAEDGAAPPLPPEVQQKLQMDEQTIQELSQKLQEAMNAIALEDRKHTNKMAEIDAAARVKADAAAGAVALKTANQDAAASGTTDSAGGDDVDAQAMQLLRELAAQVAQLQQQSGPKRSIVKPRPDGTFEVLTVPVQQQAPIPAQAGGAPNVPAGPVGPMAGAPPAAAPQPAGAPA